MFIIFMSNWNYVYKIDKKLYTRLKRSYGVKVPAQNSTRNMVFSLFPDFDLEALYANPL